MTQETEFVSRLLDVIEFDIVPLTRAGVAIVLNIILPEDDD